MGHGLLIHEVSRSKNNDALQSVGLLWMSDQLVTENFHSFGATAPQWAMAYSFTRFLDQTQRRITVGRTPLDE